MCRTVAALIAFTVGTAADGIDYNVDIVGADTNGLKSQLERTVPLLSGTRPEFDTYGALRRRAQTTIETILRVCRSEGFYRAKATYDLDLEEDPTRLVFRIDPGPAFTVTTYRVQYENPSADERPQSLTEAGLAPNGSPRGEDLETLRVGMISYLRSSGFPAARLTDHRVEAVLSEGTATAFIVIDSGPRARFGNTEWTGLDRTDPQFLDTFIPWKQGEMFDIQRVNALRDALIQTGLFTTILAEPGQVAPDGHVPIRIQLAERKPRTIGAGVSFSTNTGAGAEVFWEHRNLSGRGETLNVEAEVAQIRQGLSFSVRKPRPANRGAWFAGFEAENEDTEAFEGQTATARIGLDRTINPRWRFGTAVELEGSNIQDTFGERTTLLAAFPQRADYSSVNDPLNPTRGSKLTLQVTPQGGQSDGGVFFTTFEAKASTHVPFDKSDRYVLALWSRVGGMLGPQTEEIPANRRFYAGGAGSVRGLGFQLIGPLDEENEPIGGRSVLEGGIEMRTQVFNSIGFVTFIEAGGVFESGYPDLDTDIQSGAGLGLRYFTPIGPLRLDVAVPLERRSGIDDAFEFYISLGQAF